jgi:hypothetical protein
VALLRHMQEVVGQVAEGLDYTEHMLCVARQSLYWQESHAEVLQIHATRQRYR